MTPPQQLVLEEHSDSTGKRPRTKSNPYRTCSSSSSKASTMIVTCYLALASSPSFVVEAWNTNHYAVRSRIDAISFRDADIPTLSVAVPGLDWSKRAVGGTTNTITVQFQMPTIAHKQSRQGAGPTMLLDRRLASFPLIASLPLSYRRAEGFHSPPTTTTEQRQLQQQRRGVLGFDVFALDSTTSSSSDIDAGFMAERRGDSGVSSSTLTAALGITWHDANWKTDRNHLPTPDETIIPKTASLPTRSQIDQLKVVELKLACLERGLPRVSDCVRFGESYHVCCLC